MKIKIITDSCCDLSWEYLKNNDVEVIPFPYFINGNEYIDDFGQTLSYNDFYGCIRNGSMPTTSQITAFTYMETFKKYIEEGYSIIYIGFSSALSQTYNNSLLAIEQLKEEYPHGDITSIDSKSASVGLGLLVYYACEMLRDGKSKEEIINWVENNKLKVNHWFIIDSLDHLRRGGRLSTAGAAVGTLLDVKPLLNLDNEGGLRVVKKIRGRKRAVKELVNELKSGIVNPEEQVILINHGDCLEEAEKLRKDVLDAVPVKDTMINYVGPVIGTHTGPGMLCLVFLGEKR
ncbi:MAG TPA: DegV family protein [Tissierellia bacterium]|nr:DegV family protein [Tissierellia bacterium]